MDSEADQKSHILNAQGVALDAVASWARYSRSEHLTGRQHSPLTDLLAGTLSQLAGQVEAVRMLVARELTFEADAIVRVMAEAAIILLWIGDDEERATRFCADSATQYSAFIENLRANGVHISEQLDTHVKQYRALFPGKNLPTTKDMARARRVPPGYHRELRPGERGPSEILYDLAFKRCCLSAHPDLQTMLLIDEGRAAANIHSYRDALYASLWIIEVSSRVLRLPMNEVDPLTDVIHGALTMGQ